MMCKTWLGSLIGCRARRTLDTVESEADEGPPEQPFHRLCRIAFPLQTASISFELLGLLG